MSNDQVEVNIETFKLVKMYSDMLVEISFGRWLASNIERRFNDFISILQLFRLLTKRQKLKATRISRAIIFLNQVWKSSVETSIRCRNSFEKLRALRSVLGAVYRIRPMTIERGNGNSGFKGHNY